jgi:hypothetical protein
MTDQEKISIMQTVLEIEILLSKAKIQLAYTDWPDPTSTQRDLHKAFDIFKTKFLNTKTEHYL